MQQTGDIPAEAKAHNCIGEISYFLGNLKDAMSSYKEALGLWDSSGHRHGRAQTLLYLGYAHSDLSELEQALGYYGEALSIWRSQGEKRGQALTQVALGRLNFRMGENQQALNFYLDAKELIDAMGDAVWQASVRAGMGSVYYRMGEYQKALNYRRQAVNLFRSAGLRMAELELLLSLGETFVASGDYEKALDHFQEAHTLSLDLSNQRWESLSLGLIGSVHHSLGNLNEALQYYERSLSIKRPGEDRRYEAYTLGNIGRAHEQLGESDKARSYFSRAIALSNAASDQPGEAAGLFNLARSERNRGDLSVARRHIESSLRIIESLRNKVDSQYLRGAFIASVHDHYELYVDLLMSMDGLRPSEGFAVAAFEACERARARTLLDSLTEAGVDIRQGVESDLLERERSLQRELNTKAEHQMQLLSSGTDEVESAAIEKKIQELTTEYEQLQSLIRSKSPRYAALTQPQPLSLEAIQREVLDDETLLLEYALGEERSFLWAVTEKAYTSHELPPRAEIEGSARTVYELLTARQPLPGDDVRKHRTRVKEADSRYWQEAARLSEMVLGPVADQLESKRLLVVSDGLLQYLPFGALPVPGTEGNSNEPVPLVVEHDMVSMPSASTLAVLRRETAGRKVAAKAVAVLADPVFERDDPRLGGEGAESQKAVEKDRVGASHDPPVASDLHRALRDIGFVREGRLRIPRLPSTRREAEAIIAAVPPGAGLEAIDFRASRKTATDSMLADYRIIHFATHGLLNNEHPELSGILLSMVDEKGGPQNGFLRLHDIYNLNLPVELVVLSACNSGLGKNVRGEGLVGIVRGFMYAGAERVVASLWKVDDEATGDLMKVFYKEIFREGVAPAAALRKAQIAMWQQEQWRAPFYWAAFVLQGEWM